MEINCRIFYLLKGFHYTAHTVSIFPLSGKHFILGHPHSACLLYGKSFKHIKLIISVTQFQLIPCAHSGLGAGPVVPGWHAKEEVSSISFVHPRLGHWH